jgi:hypothetical protein
MVAPAGGVAPSPAADRVLYVEKPGNGLAVAALVTGIVGVVLGMIPILFFVGWGLGITAFVLGLVGRGRAKKRPEVGRKTMATWGVVLGIAAFGLGCAGYSILTSAVDDLNQTTSCIDNANTVSEMNLC